LNGFDEGLKSFVLSEDMQLFFRVLIKIEKLIKD